MKKIIVIFVFTLLSLVMISCEGALTGITFPDGFTTDPPQTTLDTQTQTTSDIETSQPTTEDLTQNPSTSDVTTSQITTSSETTSSQEPTEEPTTEAPTTVPTTEQPTTVPTTTNPPTTEDRATEINNLKLIMQNNDMDVTDEEAFASELYDNGMRSSNLISMMSDISTLMAVSPEADMTDVYTVVDLVMEDMDREMMRAVLSAVIKVEVRNNLQAQIEPVITLSLEEGMTDKEIHMIESMIDFIDLYGDDAVDSVMMVIEYIMDVQAVIEPSYIQNIEDLSAKETYTSIDLNMMVMVKNGFINSFKNALPSQNDFSLFNLTIINFLDILTEDDIDYNPIKADKQATMQRMSIELFYDFLLSVDDDFVTALYNFSQNSEDAPTIKIFAHEVIGLVDDFTDDYSTDIQAVEDVMSDAEKEALFNDFLLDQVLPYILNDEFDSTTVDSISTILDTYIDYDNLDDMMTIMRSLGDDLIDGIVTNDYALVDAFIDMTMIKEEDYSNMDDYNLAMQTQFILIINEGLDVLNPMIQDGVVEEYTVVIDLVADVIGLQIEMQGLMESYDTTDQMLLYDIINTSIYNTKSNQLSIMQKTFDFAATSGYIDSLYPIIMQMNQSPSEETMAQFAIELANAFIDYHTLIASDIDAIELEVQNLTSNTNFVTLTDITQADIDEVNAIFDNFIPGILAQATLIKDYDYTDLTTQEIANVQIFLSYFIESESQPTN